MFAAFFTVIIFDVLIEKKKKKKEKVYSFRAAYFFAVFLALLFTKSTMRLFDNLYA